MRCRTPEERWNTYVSTDGDCWEWRGAREKSGYGKVTHEGRRVWAHRWAYEMHVGPIPEGLEVRHTCDNPPCVRPDHLVLGTHADNMRDVADRLRHSRRQRVSCAADHPYTEETTYWSKRGARVCRVCRRAQQQNYLRKQKELSP